MSLKTIGKTLPHEMIRARKISSGTGHPAPFAKALHYLLISKELMVASSSNKTPQAVSQSTPRRLYFSLAKGHIKNGGPA